MPSFNPHIEIFLYGLFRFLNSVIVLIKVIYEIIIHLIILKSSFYQQKVLNKHCQPTPKKRYLNSNNSQCSVTSKQNIYIKKKIFHVHHLKCTQQYPLHTQTHRQRLLVFNMHQNCNVNKKQATKE